MISEKITKQQFIVQVLERDIRNIYRVQLAIAQRNIYVEGKKLKITKRLGPRIGVRFGSLLQSLQNPDYLIQAQGEKFIVSAGIVKHIRFIDMKKFGNRRIYNRQVWGILYNNAMKDIEYNYGSEIRNIISEKLQEALGTNMGHMRYPTA
jgi:hypothetical protein